MSLNMNCEHTNNNIYSFLEEHTVKDGQEYTHTSLYSPKGSYYIKGSDLDTFYQLYEKELFNGNELHITEKHESIGPMIIDLDFKYEIDTHERKHTAKDIQKIIRLYNDEISDLFEIDKDSEKMVSFVFERDNLYTNKGFAKDGIHILYPFIVSSPEAQYYIRDNILKKIHPIIENFGLKNTIPDIVDRAVIYSNVWLLYGSNKERPKDNPYKLKYLFNGNGEEESIVNYFGSKADISLVRFFSIRNRGVGDLVPIKPDKAHHLEAYSIKKKTNASSLKLKQSGYVNYDIERIRELVSILSADRAENYGSWIEVGWMLHNIDPNSQELLDIWIEFSKRSNKFEDGVCEREWARSKNEGLTIATLHYWAKIDNYQKYMEFKNKDINKYIEYSIKSQSNYDIAKVLYMLFQYDFVYSDNDWYIYKNHKWNKESDGMSLRQKISNELCDKYIKIISEYNKQASAQNITEEEKEEFKKKSKDVFSLTTKLKTTAFKENIMKECKELFSNKEFIQKLDTNVYLMGFANGVYDLEKGELRDGRPDDYIEMTTEIDKVDFDENHEYWPELKHFIETVFFEEEIKNYFLTYLASCLQGHNAEEKFRIWNGHGCHAYDTDIMMADGSIKKVQEINIGDKLMGDDSTERNVIELKRGFSQMVRFYGKGFDEYTVNMEHILCLVHIRNKNNIVEISVNDFLNKIKDKDYYRMYDKDMNLFEFMYDTSVPNANFYGFEIDGNHRYQMGNAIVTHNSNGKSKMLELFVHCLGMYSIKFPVTMLTGKRAASNACTPEMVRAKGKRFGYLEEPSENERIDAGFLKELTGGDKITARGLHKEPIDFKPQFKLALLCNEIPKVPPNDSGTWRRMEVIEFKSRFCDNPKQSHEFPIDKYLSEKLKKWKELFMALLIDVYYVKYRKNGIVVPDEVIKFTLEYQKTCDLYTDFIVENLEDTNDRKNDSIDIVQLYDEFKVWYEDAFGNRKYPSKIEFKRYLKKKYGNDRINQADIRGFKFRIKYDKQNPQGGQQQPGAVNQNSKPDPKEVPMDKANETEQISNNNPPEVIQEELPKTEEVKQAEESTESDDEEIVEEVQEPVQELVEEEIEVPDDNNAPDNDAPDNDAPDGDALNGDAPDGDAPDGDALNGDAPDGDALNGDAPEGDAPDGDAPDGDAPDTEDDSTEKKCGIETISGY